MNRPALRSRGLGIAAILTLGLVACDEAPTTVRRSVSLAQAASVIRGTYLSVFVDGPTLATGCVNGKRDVYFDVGATSTAAGAGVKVFRFLCTDTGGGCTPSTDPTGLEPVLSWASGSFTQLEGSLKQFGPSTDTLQLAPGSYVVTYCAEQPAWGNNERFYDCATKPVAVTECPVVLETGCGRRETDVFFGNLPSNKALCTGRGVVPLHFVGDADEAVYALVEFPPDYVTSVALKLDRAGDSCNYQGRWNPNTDNGGAGNYQFRVFRDAARTLPLGTPFVAEGLDCGQ